MADKDEERDLDQIERHVRKLAEEYAAGFGLTVHKLNNLQHLVEELIHLLRQLLPHHISSFRIQQLQGDNRMGAIIGIKAGATGAFTATPLPPGSTLPAGVVPKWVSSDPTNAPVTPSTDGLAGSVAVPTGVTITSFTLTVSLPDGTAASTVTVPILPAGPPTVTGFDITQTS